MEKDNAWQMFGYRVKFNRNVKLVVPPEHENTNSKYRTDLGQADCKSVSYRYENLGSHQTKRKILRLLPDQSQDVNTLNRMA
jgi:hypothetical protein